MATTELKPRTNWRKRFIVGGFVGLIASGIVITVSLFADDPRVPRYQSCCLVDDFNSYFRAGSILDRKEGLDSAFVIIRVADLEQRMNDAEEMADAEDMEADDYGLKVEHGLKVKVEGFVGDTNFTYSPAISFVTLNDEKDDEWVEQEIPGIRDTVSGAYVLRPAVAGWTGLARYTRYMFVQTHESNSNSWARTTPEADVKTFVFPFKRIVKLLGQNNDSSEYVRIDCIAEPLFHSESGMLYMRHHATMMTLDADTCRLLDDETYSWGLQGYKRKALDVGSPCPPRCPKAYLPDHGVVVRKTCKKEYCKRCRKP